MNLDKDPSSWARVSPEAVLHGSEAQRVNVLAMAKHDIAALDAENDRLRTALHAIRKRCDGKLGPGRSTAVNEIADMADAALR